MFGSRLVSRAASHAAGLAGARPAGTFRVGEETNQLALPEERPSGAGAGDPQLSRGSPLAFCALRGLALALRPQQLQEAAQGIRAAGDWGA